MVFVWIGLGFLAVNLGAVAYFAYYGYRESFAVGQREEEKPGVLPPGTAYETHRRQVEAWMNDMETLPHEDCAISSFDGLTLRGRLYEFAPDAPVELMFHGYRGTARRDLCGSLHRCRAMGHSALVVDHRGCGGSQGKCITFGIFEHRDCHSWIAYLRERFGNERKILLMGVSMGAATVMMAAARPLPDNVAAIIADCGFSSPKEILCRVMKHRGLNPRLMYPLLRLGGMLYGHFDPDALTPLEALTQCAVPVFFVHGEGDRFVPPEMSRANFDACAAPKRLCLIPKAGHCLCYLTDPDRYTRELTQFLRENGV